MYLRHNKIHKKHTLKSQKFINIYQINHSHRQNQQIKIPILGRDLVVVRILSLLTTENVVSRNNVEFLVVVQPQHIIFRSIHCIRDATFF